MLISLCLIFSSFLFSLFLFLPLYGSSPLSAGKSLNTKTANGTAKIKIIAPYIIYPALQPYVSITFPAIGLIITPLTPAIDELKPMKNAVLVLNQRLIATVATIDCVSDTTIPRSAPVI